MIEPLGLFEACKALRLGTLKPDEYLRDCNQRADAVEPWLHAFVFRDTAMQFGGVDSADSTNGAISGPLAGIPVGVKDIIDTAGLPTACGSAAFEGRVPTADAAIVRRLKSLGAVIFGKTVTTEFAWRHPGATVNPYNRAHTPGGSSSGSAAAVAAGIVPLALGSQTLGSIIRPAAYCGVVGYKGSFGAIPRAGAQPLAGSLDHIGFFARHVDDVALAFNLLRHLEPSEPGALCLPPVEFDPVEGVVPQNRPRLAVLRPYPDKVEPDQTDAFALALDKLRAAGIELVETDMPTAFWKGSQAVQTVLDAEGAQIYGPLVRDMPERTSAKLKELVAHGAAIPAVDYLDALSQQATLREQFGAALTHFDAAISMPATGPAPEGLAWTGDATFCGIWTFMGVPSITLPVMRNAKGLPLGIQLNAPYGQDGRLLRAAKRVEQALGVRLPVPG